MKRFVVSILALLVPVLAHAEEDAPSPLGTRQRFTKIELGSRVGLVTDPGLDPFSRKDGVWQLTLGASRTVLTSGRFSFAPGLAWDYGSSSEQARGLPSSLHAHRLTIPLDARWHLLPQMFVFARFAPGAAWQKARVEDGSAPAALVRSSWLPAFDASAGAAYLVGPGGEPRSRTLRFWLTAEGGYAWAPSMRLDLSPDLGGDDPRRAGAAPLRELALRGPFMRLGVALSF